MTSLWMSLIGCRIPANWQVLVHFTCLIFEVDGLWSIKTEAVIIIIIIIIPAKAREYVFTGVGLCVCVSVCDHDY